MPSSAMSGCDASVALTFLNIMHGMKIQKDTCSNSGASCEQVGQRGIASTARVDCGLGWAPCS
jgi:hypothetical protein